MAEHPRAEAAPPGSGHHEDAGDLAHLAGQQAQPGAAEDGVVLARYQQQAAGRSQVVARLRPHGRRDLLVGGRAAVVPAGEFGEVGPQDPARGGGRRRHDRDDRLCAGVHSQGAVAEARRPPGRARSGPASSLTPPDSGRSRCREGLVRSGGGRRWRAATGAGVLASGDIASPPGSNRSGHPSLSSGCARPADKDLTIRWCRWAHRPSRGRTQAASPARSCTVIASQPPTESPANAMWRARRPARAALQRSAASPSSTGTG